LVDLLQHHPPEVLWHLVRSGEIRRPPPDKGAATKGTRVCWAEVAARWDVGRRWAGIVERGIRVAYLGGAEFPDVLAQDPAPPGVLFWLGSLEVLQQPRVAVIGTRHGTGYGLMVAEMLGRDLAECGVSVISGLALGVDGAAHVGALAAPGGGGPVGVAASGVDLPYPRRHTELWGRVAAAGAVISETAPGQPAQAWRFPARNRLIAGLAQAVVVVESHTAGGSMLTVAAAAERGVDVLAVPGPVTSAASAGTNQLLHEGVCPARDAGDVLAVLGDLRPWPAPQRRQKGRSRAPGPSVPARPRGSAQPALPGWAGETARRSGHSPALDGPMSVVLKAIDRTPTATNALAERTGLPVGQLSVLLLRLEGMGLVRGQGIWWERCDGQ
jgi:DNA processing protein